MATPKNSVVTRPWIDLTDVGLRALHTKDSQNRHMVLLAPMDPEEGVTESRDRLNSHAVSLNKITGTQNNPVKGALYKDKYWILTGSGLSTFKGIWTAIQKGFPQVRLQQDTPLHFINLPRYLQYTAALAVARENQQAEQGQPRVVAQGDLNEQELTLIRLREESLKLKDDLAQQGMVTDARLESRIKELDSRIEGILNQELFDFERTLNGKSASELEVLVNQYREKEARAIDVRGPLDSNKLAIVERRHSEVIEADSPDHHVRGNVQENEVTTDDRNITSIREAFDSLNNYQLGSWRSVEVELNGEMRPALISQKEFSARYGDAKSALHLMTLDAVQLSDGGPAELFYRPWVLQSDNTLVKHNANRASETLITYWKEQRLPVPALPANEETGNTDDTELADHLTELNKGLPPGFEIRHSGDETLGLYRYGKLLSADEALREPSVAAADAHFENAYNVYLGYLADMPVEVLQSRKKALLYSLRDPDTNKAAVRIEMQKITQVLDDRSAPASSQDESEPEGLQVIEARGRSAIFLPAALASKLISDLDTRMEHVGAELKLLKATVGTSQSDMDHLLVERQNLQLKKWDIEAGQLILLIESSWASLDDDTRKRIDALAPNYHELTSAVAAASKEPNLAAAIRLVNEQRRTFVDDHKAIEQITEQAKTLALNTPVNHERTVLALDILATRFNIDEGFEFADDDPNFVPGGNVQGASVSTPINDPENRATLKTDNDQHAGGQHHDNQATNLVNADDDDDRALLESGDGQPGLDGSQHADPAGSESTGESDDGTGQHAGTAETSGIAGGILRPDGTDGDDRTGVEDGAGTGAQDGSGDTGSADANDSSGVLGSGSGPIRSGDAGRDAGRSSEGDPESDTATGGAPQNPVQDALEETGSTKPGERSDLRTGAGSAESKVGGAGTEGEQPHAVDSESPTSTDGRDGHRDEQPAVPSGEHQSAGLNRFSYPQGHDLGGKSRPRRVEDNIAAMRTLFEIEEQGREATDEEKSILAEYSGWGGIHANLFSGYWGGQKQPDYVINARNQINDWLSKGTLSTTDHRLLTGTVLNAHFTHSGVIRPMWKGIGQLGVPVRRILEPSCGVLNFKGYLPETMGHESQFTGVELDPITARIAQHVHPDAKVHAIGFEEAPVRDNFFDVAISNVPFGEYPVFDRNNPQWSYRIHNYFFLKSLQKLKPGGVTAFVTSSYTMDAQDTNVREAIMEDAHVIGAFRLPMGTFAKNTQTEVMTDIIFLQKKGNFTPSYQPVDIRSTGSLDVPLATSSGVWVDSVFVEPGQNVKGMSMNQYFIDNPEHVLGNLGVLTTQHGPALRVLGNDDIPELESLLEKTITKSLPKNIALPVAEITLDADIDRIAETQKASRTGGSLDDLIPGAIYFDDNQQAFHTIVVNAAGEKLASDKPVKVAKKNIDRMHQLIALMETSRELLILQSETETPSVEQKIVQLRTLLNEQYHQFSVQYGPVSAPENEKLYRKDTRAPFLYGLEKYDESTGVAEKTAIFEKRVVTPTAEPPAHASNAVDALAISLAYTGSVSLPYMRQLLRTDEFEPTEQDVLDTLLDQELVFVNPDTDKPEIRDEYLSGNLAPKIKAAEQAAASDPAFKRNLDALIAHLPEPLKPSQIKVGMDAFWLPKDVLADFLSEALDLDIEGLSGVEPTFDEVNRYWKVQPIRNKSLNQVARDQDHLAHTRWGTERAHVFRLLDNIFTNTQPIIRDKVQDNPPRYETNHAETLKAQGKYEEIVDAFNRWIYKDPQRAHRLAEIYNERFNTWRLVEPDGSHMVYPGMSPSWAPFPHQNNFIWRAISGRNSLTAHVVGAGKTMQLIGSAVRGKQLNRWQKPLLVVPNHMLRQFAGDAQTIYPSSRVLVLDKDDITPARRAEFVARAAMGDWDLIVCTHSSFSRIGVPTAFEAEMLETEMASLKNALEIEKKSNGAGSKSHSQRDIEKKIKSMEAKLKRMNHAISQNKDDVLNLEEMGIDFVGVDEAHYYKNLAVDSARQIPGVSTSESVRAWDMFIKCRYLQDLHGGPYGVMMATGTPISNSVVECYTFTRMMRPDLLEGAGIHNFNDWMSLFGEIQHAMEIKPEGGGYQVKSRLSRFKNIPELVKMIREFIDFKTREDLNLPTPKIHTETVVAPQTDLMSMFMKYIEARARTVRGGRNGSSSLAQEIATELRKALYGQNSKARLDERGNVDPDKEATKVAQDILLSIATDGRKASLDPRLIHPSFPDDPNSKVNLCVQKALELYEKYDADKAAQLIFCDFSSPTGKGIFNVYDDIKAKLIKAGVPENEIAFIHDAVTDDDKEELFAKVRSGEVRFLLGSTTKMGVGTNVQERLIALHQLDPPWKPADIEQRLGRVDRQGNMFEEAYNFIYTTADSFDLFMWETLNRKLAMIKQAMRNPDDCEREMDEDVSMGYEDILAVTTGNPKIKDFIDTRLQMDKLKRMESSYLDEQSDLAAKIAYYEKQIREFDGRLEVMREEQDLVNDNRPLHLLVTGAQPGLQDGDTCHIGGLKGLAAALEKQSNLVRAYTTRTIGHFGGLEVVVSRMNEIPQLHVIRHDGTKHWVGPLATETGIEDMLLDEDKEVDPIYKVARQLANTVHKIGNDNGIEVTERNKENLKRSLEAARGDLGKPFERFGELEAARIRYQALSEELGDVMAEGAQMDPLPLISFAKLVMEETNAPIDREFLRSALGLSVDLDDQEDEAKLGPQMA